MKRLAALVAFTLFTVGVRGAPLGDNTVRLAPSQLKLPQSIGPLRFSGPNRFSDRRLGPTNVGTPRHRRSCACRRSRNSASANSRRTWRNQAHE